MAKAERWHPVELSYGNKTYATTACIETGKLLLPAELAHLIHEGDITGMSIKLEDNDGNP